MKKKCYIAFMAFAVAVMLTAAFMPHHHHKGMLCTEVEYCEDDERYNDEHTGHNQGDTDHCIDKSDFITAKRFTNIEDAGTNLLPIFILAERLVLCLSQHDDYTNTSIYRQPLYKSADLHPYNILRGPPFLFV